MFGAGVHFYLGGEFIGDAVAAKATVLMIHAGLSEPLPSLPAANLPRGGHTTVWQMDSTCLNNLLSARPVYCIAARPSACAARRSPNAGDDASVADQAGGRDQLGRFGGRRGLFGNVHCLRH